MKVKVKDYVRIKGKIGLHRVCIVNSGDVFWVDYYNNYHKVNEIEQLLPYGEKILVSDNKEGWDELIFIDYDEGFDCPFRVVGYEYEQEFKQKECIQTDSFIYAKPINNKKSKLLEKANELIQKAEELKKEAEKL